MKTIKQRIADYFNVSIDAVEICEPEERENHKGEKLQDGSPVYINFGIDGEPSEFVGWIINGKWYNETATKEV